MNEHCAMMLDAKMAIARSITVLILGKDSGREQHVYGSDSVT